MSAIVTVVSAVRPHGDNLSIVTVDGNEVVANRQEDGSFRWAEGEAVVYVPEGMIVPDDVLRERGYWDEEKGKGLLEGKKGNRVKMRRFAGHESRGLLFKIVEHQLGSMAGDLAVTRGGQHHNVVIGADVTEFLGLTVHVAG